MGFSQLFPPCLYITRAAGLPDWGQRVLFMLAWLPGMVLAAWEIDMIERWFLKIAGLPPGTSRSAWQDSAPPALWLIAWGLWYVVVFVLPLVIYKAAGKSLTGAALAFSVPPLLYFALVHGLYFASRPWREK